MGIYGGCIVGKLFDFICTYIFSEAKLTLIHNNGRNYGNNGKNNGIKW